MLPARSEPKAPGPQWDTYIHGSHNDTRDRIAVEFHSLPDFTCGFCEIRVAFPTACPFVVETEYTYSAQPRLRADVAALSRSRDVIALVEVILTSTPSDASFGRTRGRPIRRLRRDEPECHLLLTILLDTPWTGQSHPMVRTKMRNVRETVPRDHFRNKVGRLEEPVWRSLPRVRRQHSECTMESAGRSHRWHQSTGAGCNCRGRIPGIRGRGVLGDGCGRDALRIPESLTASRRTRVRPPSDWTQLSRRWKLRTGTEDLTSCSRLELPAGEPRAAVNLCTHGSQRIAPGSSAAWVRLREQRLGELPGVIASIIRCRGFRRERQA